MTTHFETTLDLIIYTRERGQTDWQEFDRGPGKFSLSSEMEAGIRIFRIDDLTLKTLVSEIDGCDPIVFLNLAENRKITNKGLEVIKPLTRLTMLNLSSCDIANQGLEHLAAFTRLAWLNLSYCNRISDNGLRFIKKLKNLSYLDLQGCVHVTRAGVNHISRDGLTIHW
jgi:hypothetical protein